MCYEATHCTTHKIHNTGIRLVPFGHSCLWLVNDGVEFLNLLHVWHTTPKTLRSVKTHHWLRVVRNAYMYAQLYCLIWAIETNSMGRKLCAFRWLISRPQFLNLRSLNQIRRKWLLSRKLRHFRGSRFTQRFILSTSLHESIPNEVLCR